MKSDYEAIKEYLEAKGYGQNEASQAARKAEKEIAVIRAHPVQPVAVPAALDAGLGLTTPQKEKQP